MARKGWGALSPTYRKRLEKAGIDQTAYDSGASIQGARGHANTPERPSQVINPPFKGGAPQFPNYRAERKRLVDKIVQRKEDMFGTQALYNPNFDMSWFKSKPPAMRLLRKWVKWTEEEWLDAIREDRDVAAYLGYH